jgi:hypothetical protein
MKVCNIHTRALGAPADRLAPLIDRLASEDDCLWPVASWPRMAFDRGLTPGAVGGHGPLGYSVESYEPGRMVEFRFTRPTGFDGTHRFDLEGEGSNASRLTHTIDMKVGGKSAFRWLFVIRPLHDALIEDALDRADRFAGGTPAARKWPPWVRFLRKTLRAKGK